MMGNVAFSLSDNHLPGIMENVEKNYVGLKKVGENEKEVMLIGHIINPTHDHSSASTGSKPHSVALSGLCQLYKV